MQQRITLEVQQAHARFEQARETYQSWHDRILPPLQQAVHQAGKAYEAGDVSYSFVLEAQRRHVEALLHDAEAAAEMRRAAAELDRSIGSKQ